MRTAHCDKCRAGHSHTEQRETKKQETGNPLGCNKQEKGKGQWAISSFLQVSLECVCHASAKLFAGTSDTTANMNKFGVELEASVVYHGYCSDHNMQLTCKICYDDPKTGRSLAGTLSFAIAAIRYARCDRAALHRWASSPLCRIHFEPGQKRKANSIINYH